MGSISKNFSYSEFEKSDIADRFGIINNITTTEVKDAIKALVLNVLQPLRSAWKEPLVVNSGYRCPELNSHPLINGSKTSQHVKGEAADIECSSPNELARLAAVMALPYDQMIIYPDFVHFSHKLNGEQRGQILYSRKYKGARL